LKSVGKPQKNKKLTGASIQPRRGLLVGKPTDAPFLILVLLLLGTGLICMFSASYATAYYDQDNPLFYIIRQAAFAGAGLVAMYFVSFINYQKLHHFAIPLLIVSVVLMALVFTPLGVVRNEARRWLNLGFTQFQPSEIVKFAVILAFSSFATKLGEKMHTFKYGILPFLGILGVFILMLKEQPHLSAAIIIGGTGLILIFVAGANMAWLVGMGSLGVVGAVAFVFTNEYAMERIHVWFDPFIDPLDKGWQGVQSFIAIGSGGFWGLGLGQSRQKHLYLPEPANDFIFSVICEELGFFGAMIIILVFAALIVRGFWIAMRAPDKFGCLLVTGIVTQIAIQTIVNMCVVCGLMPITGASLPFFSYGGTSLTILLAEVGVVLAVARQIPAAKSG